MAGDWIKIRIDLDRDPAVFTMAQDLDISRAEVVGLLVRFWSWASEQTADGLLKVPAETIDDFVGEVGFSRVMAEVGWIERDNGHVKIVDFDRHMSKSAKERAVNSQRQKVSRSCRAFVAPNARPEKRREEKSIKNPPTPLWGLLPESMQTEDLKTTLDAYERHRVEKRARLTATARSRLASKLHKMGHDVALRAVRTSLENGWTGVFEPDGKDKAPKVATTVAAKTCKACGNVQRSTSAACLSCLEPIA